jgi:predicted RNA methylase
VQELSFTLINWLYEYDVSLIYYGVTMTFPFFLIRLEKVLQALRSKRLLCALLNGRVLAGAEHRQVLRRNLTTVVDIGANRGQFSLAVRQWTPRARVVAFEPMAGAATVFERSSGEIPG